MRSLAIMVGLVLLPGAAAADAAARSAAYAVCQACHQPDGNGLAGIFPPVRNRTAAMAALEGGREYVIAVTLYGLQGSIEIDGQTYNGFMAGHKGLLDPESMALALNHTVVDLNDHPDEGFEAFTAEEIQAVDADMGGSDPTAMLEMRARLRDQHGDQWPQ